MSSELTIVLIGIITLAIGLFLGMYIQKLKTKSNESVWEEKEQQFSNKVAIMEKNLNELGDAKAKLEIESAKDEIKFKNLEEKLEEQKKNEETLQEKFENLANKIFDDKNEKFKESSKENLEGLINPLKEKIKEFKEKVEGLDKQQLQRHTQLGSELKNLRELNQTIGTEAQNLTKALKQDKQLQGSWGELILEKVLEKSGLEKDVAYSKQKSFIDESGQRQRPDYIINFPDNRKIIVDSKVSLVDYEKYINEEDDLLKTNNLIQHIKSIWKHVEDLSKRNYHKLYNIESPDYVLMFVPIETAFSAAVNEKPRLYDEAFIKNVVIVTPSTLLATLKTIETIWQSDKQRKYTIEIAKQAGQLHDKFVGMLKDFEKIETQIKTVQGTVQNAKTKLSGSGGISSKIKNLKSLGATASKVLDQKWLEDNQEIENYNEESDKDSESKS